MKLYISHPSIKNNPLTYLNADYVAAVTTLKVKNTQGFSTSKFALIGNLGLDQAEIIRPTTVTVPDTLVTAATKFPHNVDTKVVLLDYDKVRIYRSTTGAAGVYTLLATADITVDQDVTSYEDLTALSSYYYKFAFYNSFTLTESELTDPYAATGFVFHSLGTLINRVLSLFGDSKAEFVTRDEVKEFLQEFYEDAQRELAIATKRHNISTHTFYTESNKDNYDLPGDFINEVAVKLSLDNGVNYPYTIPMKQIDAISPSYGNRLRYNYTIYGSKIYLDDPIPATTSDRIKLLYTPSFVTLSLPTDTLAVPFNTASAMFVRYALGMCYLKDKKSEEYEMLTNHARERLKEFISYIKKLNNVHVQFSGGGNPY